MRESGINRFGVGIVPKRTKAEEDPLRKDGVRQAGEGGLACAVEAAERRCPRKGVVCCPLTRPSARERPSCAISDVAFFRSVLAFRAAACSSANGEAFMPSAVAADMVTLVRSNLSRARASAFSSSIMADERSFAV